MGSLPGDVPAVLRQGRSSSRGGWHSRFLPRLPPSPHSTNLPLGRHPRGLAVYGERGAAALLQSPPLFPRPLQREGQSPLRNAAQGFSPSAETHQDLPAAAARRQGSLARQGLSSPAALPEAAQTHLHGGCSRRPETACAGEQQEPPSLLVGPRAAGPWGLAHGVRGAFS